MKHIIQKQFKNLSLLQIFLQLGQGHGLSPTLHLGTFVSIPLGPRLLLSQNILPDVLELSTIPDGLVLPGHRHLLYVPHGFPDCADL